MKSMIALLALLTSSQSFAADLPLADARFVAPYVGYVCEQLKEEYVATPQEFEAIGLQFDKLESDRMTLNFRITANFVSNEKTCRYSSILSRTKIRNRLVMTQSQAEAIDEGADCNAGKELLDASIGNMSYNFTKNPIRFIGLKFASTDAARICGEDFAKMRIVFEKQPTKK